MTAKLQELVDKSRARVMSPSQEEEQRIGFAYGNAPKDDRHTRETIREIANAQRGISKAKPA